MDIYFKILYNFSGGKLETLEILKNLENKELDNFPAITHSNLYKKVIKNFCYEFIQKEENYLISPFYTILTSNKNQQVLDLLEQNTQMLDTLKLFIINSLFVYSAIIEENSYYLSDPQSLFICRIIHLEDSKFELRFYTHHKDEVIHFYADKIYIGRDWIDLSHFERKYLGLKANFQSLIEQNDKMQERAKQKLKYYSEFKKPYLDEIKYLCQETVTEALKRMKSFPESKLNTVPKIKFNELLDHILYILNLMLELRDFTAEFAQNLRTREETNYAKYLTKFLKDINDDIRYLRKLTILIHVKISNFIV